MTNTSRRWGLAVVATLLAEIALNRTSLREFIATFPVNAWDVPQEFTILDHLVRVTPKKIVIHVVLHEIRHWVQIATLLRLHGLKGEFHDFLASPVLGGEFRRLDGKP